MEGYLAPIEQRNEISRKDVVVSIVNDVSSMVDKAMDYFFNNSESNNEEERYIFTQLRPSFDVLQSKRRCSEDCQKSRVLARRNRAQDFVNGTTTMDDFLCLLGRLPPIEDRTFVDFGCGDGSLLLSVALAHFYQPCFPMFVEVIGIDLDHARATEAFLKLEYLKKKVSDQHQFVIPKYAVYEDDFHSVSLPSPVHVIYACATCFTESTRLVVLQRAAELLQPDGVLILLDWKLSEELLSSFGFAYSDEAQCQTSWGTGIAYVYIKTGV